METQAQIMSEGAPFVGDHPALDLLNTIWRVNGELVDSLQSDQDVLLWLRRAGWSLNNELKHLPPLALLNAARTLREMIRDLITSQKAGTRPEVASFNGFLAESQAFVSLVPEGLHGLALQRRWKNHTPEQVLGPLAESAAELIALGDLSLIKCCEDKNCVLWFYDRTKSHRRRWCSPATCGNRHKVAAFRSRRRTKSPDDAVSVV